MLKRKIYDKLLDWKNRKSRECLLVQGARQIGKTFIIEEFGRREYESYVYLNFYRNPEHKRIFEGSLEAEEIYKKISLYVRNVRFLEKETLIFLDEIQDCPNARTALKFLAIDDRYDVIASGSMLGLCYKEMASIPVGYERSMEMYSLDFEEYLWAVGRTPSAIQALRGFFERKEKVDAGMIKLCVNVSTPQFPLVAYEKPDQFKAYVTDIGLLASLYGYDTQAALLKDTLTGPAKGGIYENLVFDMLTKRGLGLNYFKNDKNTQEIEFLLVRDGAVIPIEVKSKRGATVSLNHFMEEFAPPYAYKLVAGNVGVSDAKITLPLYMAMFL